VGIDITHTYIGDLRVTLVSPTGREVVLHGRLGGTTDNLVATYSSEPPSPLASLVGQPVQGLWMLKVVDLAWRDIGTLNKWSLEVRIGG
jgi:subtilisin-like proprotein convertase family protein